MCPGEDCSDAREQEEAQIDEHGDAAGLCFAAAFESQGKGHRDWKGKGSFKGKGKWSMWGAC